jgi:hypothetical protein
VTPEEKVQILLEHPDESPEIIGMLPYLIDPPSRLSSSERWWVFRDRTLLPAIAANLGHPNLLRFLARTEKNPRLTGDRCARAADREGMTSHGR